MLQINGHRLDIDQVVSVAEGMPVSLDPSALPAIVRAREAVDELVAERRIAYGITTGFGRFKDKLIPAEQVKQLQLNLVRSHAAGVGPLLDEKTVRAMMIARANTLAIGCSGVRPAIIELLLSMLNAGIHPVIPCQGSLGASGDLAPLAHLTLALIGEGEVWKNGRRIPSLGALTEAGITPVELEAKEGLALVNGTAMMVGMGALLVKRALNLAATADIAACLTLEATHGTASAYDARVHEIRPHPRQIECARFLRSVIKDSQFLRDSTASNVQDPYTLRCVPQVHGAVHDAIAYAEWVINIELNSANDNPLIFVDDSGNIDVVSAGNFHGEPIALAMDYAKIALVDLGNMSERRIARLVDADSNDGVLPMFLTREGGLNSGFMIAQYTAASLASENKVLAHPASADSIPSSANMEDHVSMGATATRHLGQVLDHLETIVAIELMAAAQGIDFRRQQMENPSLRLGFGSSVAYNLIRREVPFLTKDVPLAPHIELVRKLVASGTIKDRVVEQVDELAE